MHYNLLVVGANVQEQLAPFDAEIEVAPYREEYDFSDELEGARERAAKCQADERPDLRDDAAVLCWDHGLDNVEHNPEGGLFLVSTVNPIGKYDWYVVGGRWQESVLRVKPYAVLDNDEAGNAADGEVQVGYFNVCRKMDVDWEGMARDAAEDARHSWRAIHALVDGYPPITPWSEVFERTQAGRIQRNEAYERYTAQPAIIALGSSVSITDLQRYLCSEDECAQRAAAAAGVTMALIKDGQWYGMGLGWWNADSASRDGWSRHFHELLDDVPDDAMLTVVDCHS